MIVHLFAVAMIGCYQGLTVGCQHRFLDTSDTGIQGFDGFHRRFKIAGMANHVPIGEVDDNELMRTIFDTLNNGIGNFKCRHLRF